MIHLYFLLLQATMPANLDAGALNTSVSAGSLVDATLVIAEDTPVELLATAEVSTADAKPGTRFKLRVNRPVMVSGRVAIPEGTPAFGEVIFASDAGGLGKSGHMSAKLLYIQLGELQIPLEGATNAKGTGSGSAGAAFVASLFNPVTLFHRGNNAKIKAGEILSGYVVRDVAISVSGRPTAAASTFGSDSDASEKPQ